jgi:hypothetical protein
MRHSIAWYNTHTHTKKLKLWAAWRLQKRKVSIQSFADFSFVEISCKKGKITEKNYHTIKQYTIHIWKGNAKLRKTTWKSFC